MDLKIEIITEGSGLLKDDRMRFEEKGIITKKELAARFDEVLDIMYPKD